jgi:hypothetical protein
MMVSNVDTQVPDAATGLNLDADEEHHALAAAWNAVNGCNVRGRRPCRRAVRERQAEVRRDTAA